MTIYPLGVRLEWVNIYKVFEVRTYNYYYHFGKIARDSVLCTLELDGCIDISTKHFMPLQTNIVWTLFSITWRDLEPSWRKGGEELLLAALHSSSVFPGNSALVHQLLFVPFPSEDVESTISPFYYSANTIQVSLGPWQLLADLLLNLALIICGLQSTNSFLLPKKSIF